LVSASNTGLSRKKYRTLQEICSRVFLQTIGFCEQRSCVPVYVLLYCLFINNRGLQSAKGGSMAGRQTLSRPARPKAEEHHIKAESNLEEYPFFAIKRRNRKLEPRVFERTLEGENEASLRQQWTVMPSVGYGTPGPWLCGLGAC
jgi:hypothetical protein